MSGDVQPKKRKDKKKKKDESPLAEEPRGTAAAFGEGDALMHSYHEHGTGGHWCAKVVFFSLLAVLVALVGLIILENRGLSELEANSVESRYAGVLDGWLEEATDDHHDQHTLELTHPNEEEHDDSEDEAADSEEDDVELEDIEHEPEDEEEPALAERYPQPYRFPLEDNDEQADGGDEDALEEDEGDQSEEDAGSDADTDADDDPADDEDDLADDDDDLADDDDDFLQHGDDENEQDMSASLSAEVPYEEVEDSTEHHLQEDSLLEEERYEQEQEERRRRDQEEGHEDGTSMIPEEEWGEEPNEERWRRELDLAEQEMNRGLLD